MKNLHTVLSYVTLAGLLSACDIASRLDHIGQPPPVTPIENPVAQSNYKPVTIPMTDYAPQDDNPNSLWTGKRRYGFFKDQRASKVGDILSIKISISDNATTSNTTTRNRKNTISISAGPIMGRGLSGVPKSETALGLAASTTPPLITNITSNPQEQGTGGITRSEAINLTVSAMVTQVLPNENMVVFGRQEVLVNFERRDLMVTGIIRREDINQDNTIPFDKIAEARLAYGGEGQISDFQQPPWGQQVFDALTPF